MLVTQISRKAHLGFRLPPHHIRASPLFRTCYSTPATPLPPPSASWSPPPSSSPWNHWATKLLVRGISGTVVLALGWTYLDNYFHTRRVRASFEEGFGVREVTKNHHTARPEELQTIRDSLSTDSNSSRYQLIYGEHGTGKSTLVAEVCEELKKRKDGAGFVYVSVSSSDSFATSLRRALQFEETEGIVPTIRRLLGGQPSIRKPQGSNA